MQFRHPQYPGRHVHSSTMRELLGLDHTAKLPREGMPVRMVELTGHPLNGEPLFAKVWVNPLPERDVGVRNQWGRLVKRSTHRVSCECPLCGKQMSAGRLFQHTC